MAFCTNCGATLPDGAAFCTYCGAKLASAPAPRPDAYTAPAYGAPAGYPAPAPRKSHTGLIIGIIAAVLVIGIVIGVLFLTGVLGGKDASGPAGTWERVNPRYDGDDPLLLVLDEDGGGYGIDRHQDYFPVRWDESSMCLFDDDVFRYTWEGDSLTLLDERSGEEYIFTRGKDDDHAGASVLQPGTYRMLGCYEGDKGYFPAESDSRYQITLVLRADGSGDMIKRGEIAGQLTWDRHFIRIDSKFDRVCFYRCDGAEFTLYYEEEIEWVFTREG